MHSYSNSYINRLGLSGLSKWCVKHKVACATVLRVCMSVVLQRRLTGEDERLLARAVRLEPFIIPIDLAEHEWHYGNTNPHFSSALAKLIWEVCYSSYTSGCVVFVVAVEALYSTLAIFVYAKINVVFLRFPPQCQFEKGPDLVVYWMSSVSLRLFKFRAW